jgi:hypothetical protein
MLISASLTKSQFQKLISTIRTLLTQIEKHREKDLEEIENIGEMDTAQIDESPDAIFKQFEAATAGDDPGFEFLNMFEGKGVGTAANAPKTNLPKAGGAKPVTQPSSNPLGGIGSAPMKPSTGDDPFGLGSNPPQPAENPLFAGITSTSKPSNPDPFSGMTDDPFTGLGKSQPKPLFEDSKREEKKVVLTGNSSDVFGLKP